MSVVKRVVVVLLLAAFSSNAAAAPADCGRLNVTLPTQDADKIFGKWVLVWSASSMGPILVGNMLSSDTEFTLRPDNSTYMFIQRIMFQGPSCTKYSINVSVQSGSDHHVEPTTTEAHSSGTTFVLTYGTVIIEREGELSQFNDSAKLYFLETCPDCLIMVYRGLLGHQLLIYRREGLHQDVEQLTAAHDHHRKLAECLGIAHSHPFIYDGSADFCRDRSSPEVPGEQS
uniref:saxitoxin and tetrodotoxin-binding protein 1-like n=1 Tax=Scatophagus argus TaxID=75038 RepID=UPI001ED7D49E|nr:saxitoxin and tetrodotoxin-binding protein 1-like [Scatophagus argus]